MNSINTFDDVFVTSNNKFPIYRWYIKFYAPFLGKGHKLSN